MKHLDVLVTAGLVIVRRQGRERWNHLNAMPLQLMYERWVRPYQAIWASPLTAFKDALEQTISQPEKSMETQSANQVTVPRPASIAQVELEIPIAAPRDRVWKALTDQVELWWPREFFASADPLRMQFDARLGGLLREESATGGGVLWYTVIALEPGTSVTMVGHIAPAFGGPSQTMLRLTLRNQGTGTVLELSDAVFGNVGERTAAGNEEGWRALFEKAFKGFVETSS